MRRVSTSYPALANASLAERNIFSASATCARYVCLSRRTKAVTVRTLGRLARDADGCAALKIVRTVNNITCVNHGGAEGRARMVRKVLRTHSTQMAAWLLQ